MKMASKKEAKSPPSLASSLMPYTAMPQLLMLKMMRRTILSGYMGLRAAREPEQQERASCRSCCHTRLSKTSQNKKSNKKTISHLGKPESTFQRPM